MHVCTCRCLWISIKQLNICFKAQSTYQLNTVVTLQSLVNSDINYILQFIWIIIRVKFIRKVLGNKYSGVTKSHFDFNQHLLGSHTSSYSLVKSGNAAYKWIVVLEKSWHYHFLTPYLSENYYTSLSLNFYGGKTKNKNYNLKVLL